MDFDIRALAGLSADQIVRLVEPTSAELRRLQVVAERVNNAWRTALRDVIIPAYADAIARSEGALGLTSTLDLEAIERALNDAVERVARETDGIERDISVIVREFSIRHTAEWIAALSAATAVNVSPIIAASDLRQLVEGSIRRSASLIRGLDDDLRRAIEREVWDAWQQRRSARALTRALQNALGFAASRAELIGVDQINKLAGEVDQLRFRQAGLDSYVWVTRGDDRVRPTHAANDGRTFRWDRPPSTGHPGSEIRCRCRARAVVKRAQTVR